MAAADDRRPDLVRSYVVAADLVAGIGDGQLLGPTPCSGYDVGTLISHLVAAGWRAVALGRGELLPMTDSPQIEVAEAADQLRRAGEEARSAWADDARLTATVDMPWGEAYTGATLVDFYLAELAAHTWDLAAATGRLDRLGAGSAARALEGARATVKPEHRDAVGVGNPFGAEVTPPAGADTWSRFAAFMGRTPVDWAH